jgi:hypothetical protein
MFRMDEERFNDWRGNMPNPQSTTAKSAARLILGSVIRLLPSKIKV